MLTNKVGLSSGGHNGCVFFAEAVKRSCAKRIGFIVILPADSGKRDEESSRGCANVIQSQA